MKTTQQFAADIREELAAIKANETRKQELLSPNRRGGDSAADLKEIKAIDRDTAKRKARIRFIRDANTCAERVPEEGIRATLYSLEQRIEAWHRRAGSLFTLTKDRNAYLRENGVRQLEEQAKNLRYIISKTPTAKKEQHGNLQSNQGI